MVEASPEVLDMLEQVRQAALNFSETEEHFPWGGRAFYREVKGRNFLYAQEKGDYLEVWLRLPAAVRQQALQMEFIEPNKYMGGRGWITARLRNQAELATVWPWLELSYRLNQPFRRVADCLPGENPLGIEYLEQVRQVAHGFGEIEEYFPFGDRAFRRKKGQIFLYATDQEDSLYVNVRLPLGEREYALSLPFVEVPKYIGHKGWVGAKVSDRDELETVLPWIEVSYHLNQPARRSKAKMT